ncbi:TetR/AcrR family transcriptional regulator [Ornithinibacillus halotolerans]|uniref:TetR family transcriptional regulator n=1 Tax=Ornithinibacillus halotolerans TaxID=1274357 RepID=A0A916S220_9BACI|nr:TetR/AcrR family transcriptional regulator [Ornithinibacillus halotolerans]GGA77658.1 TetR family transcriptional regulator [Ornithinibacillus halotolerans]
MFTEDQNLTEKQKGILAAATELFAEKGYAATSTSEIARKAGVAEGTIFRHYKSKKDLLLTIVSPTMIKVIGPTVKKDINKVLDKEYSTFQDFIRAMIANRIDFVKNNIPLIRIVIQELPFHDELKKQAIEHIGKDVFEKLRAIVQYFQAKGQIIEMHPDTIIRVVASSVLSYIFTSYVIFPENEWNEEEEIERLIEVLSNGVAKR